MLKIDDYDEQMESDRLWFERHHKATQRQRPPYHCEIEAVKRINGLTIKEVLVFEIRPGYRVKKFFTTSRTKRALRPRGFGIEKHRIEATKIESYSTKPL
jgi:hypothetical protein